jgi:hypothetical protein
MFAHAFVSTALALTSAAAMMLACAPSCLAQRFPHSSINSTRTQAQSRQALKFDEYGEVGHCDETARLDNFAIHLQKEPTATGYIIGYDGRDSLPARLGLRQLLALNYLVNQRGVNPNLLMAIKGGYRKEAATELWIASKDAPAPEPSDTIVVKKETGKSFKYNETYPETAIVEYIEFDYELENGVNAQDASTAVQEEIEPPPGLSVEQPAQTQETIVDDKDEPENYDYLWASKGYAQALAEENGIAYVIYYAQHEGAHLFKLQQIIESGQNLLVKKHGVQEERIKTIFGGYRESTIIEMWVVPPGASPPMPTPDYAQVNINEPEREVRE